MQKHHLYQLLREHKAECLCGTVAILILALNAGSIKEFIDSSQQLRASFKAEQQDNQRLQTEQLVSEQRREIAEERYRNHCTVIFSLSQKDHYTAITDGEPVLKGELAKLYRGQRFDVRTLPKHAFLPAGMEVCDVYGNTAKLVSDPFLHGLPVARDLAHTGNPDLINAAKTRERGIYSNPVR
ncbi:MAG: hypothetical protein KME13_22910 [Myxacorys californica WJT36-NPBG1]|jgi:hypothetical protein|nr:hypothetical protein [Myxacorys californica WJT36-NPBG1]